MPSKDKKKRREQGKRWRDTNLEKARASQRAYCKRNPEKTRAMVQAWVNANRDKVLAQKRAYHAANRERDILQKRMRRLAKALGRRPTDTAPIRLADPLLSGKFQETFGRKPRAGEKRRAAHQPTTSTNVSPG